MKTFGISKGQMQRAIVKFKEPPPKQPLTVCFHFPGNFLTHRYVLDIDTASEADEELMRMIMMLRAGHDASQDERDRRRSRQDDTVH